jgi:hypothetical protein
VGIDGSGFRTRRLADPFQRCGIHRIYG